jgi:hypothetical protein
VGERSEHEVFCVGSEAAGQQAQRQQHVHEGLHGGGARQRQWHGVAIEGGCACCPNGTDDADGRVSKTLENGDFAHQKGKTFPQGQMPQKLKKSYRNLIDQRAFKTNGTPRGQFLQTRRLCSKRSHEMC